MGGGMGRLVSSVLVPPATLLSHASHLASFRRRHETAAGSSPPGCVIGDPHATAPPLPVGCGPVAPPCRVASPAQVGEEGWVEPAAGDPAPCHPFCPCPPHRHRWWRPTRRFPSNTAAPRAALRLIIEQQ